MSQVRQRMELHYPEVSKEIGNEDMRSLAQSCLLSPMLNLKSI